MPNISRIIGDQAGKYGQLVDYNKENIFLQISCKK